MLECNRQNYFSFFVNHGENIIEVYGWMNSRGEKIIHLDDGGRTDFTWSSTFWGFSERAISFLVDNAPLFSKK